MLLLKFLFKKLWSYQSITGWKDEPLYTCYRLYWTVFFYFSAPIMLMIDLWTEAYTGNGLPKIVFGPTAYLIPLPFALIAYWVFVRKGKYRELIKAPEEYSKSSKFVGWWFYYGGGIFTFLWLIVFIPKVYPYAEPLLRQIFNL